MRFKGIGGATAPIARFRSQKKIADKNPIENESNHLKKVKRNFHEEESRN